jgi:prepilin-type N-terminal cleavage/methylation domain-containing protein
MNRRQRGFTLVELLVVIAIIALLMSILMPALSRVRAQAKSVLCLSNLKQWGVCFGMYADEWEGSAPRGWWA